MHSVARYVVGLVLAVVAAHADHDEVVAFGIGPTVACSKSPLKATPGGSCVTEGAACAAMANAHNSAMASRCMDASLHDDGSHCRSRELDVLSLRCPAERKSMHLRNARFSDFYDSLLKKTSLIVARPPSFYDASSISIRGGYLCAGCARSPCVTGSQAW